MTERCKSCGRDFDWAKGKVCEECREVYCPDCVNEHGMCTWCWEELPDEAFAEPVDGASDVT